MNETQDFDQEMLNKFTNHSIVEQMDPMNDEERPPKTTQEPVDFVIKQAEQSKARMFEVPGRNLSNSLPVDVNQIDQDYQMIDSHIDKTIKKKIQSYEYIDFSKLVSRSKMFKEEESQRLEIISRNGISFWHLLQTETLLLLTLTINGNKHLGFFLMF